jgi:acetylornithine deacetylase
MLSGHMDTKPAGDLTQWRTDPWAPTIRDGLLYGLGACDMKAALAAMVYAAAAWRHEVADRPGTLLLAFTADEEAASTKGASYLAGATPVTADACLIGEPSGIRSDWEYIHLVSRGVFLGKVRVYGTQMHSSLSDALGAVNASEMMARLLVAVRERVRLRYPEHPLCPEGPTINPGVLVSGGVFYGVVPGQAEFGMDIRCLPGMTAESVLEDVRALIEAERQRDPRLRAEVELVKELRGGWMAPTEIPATHPLVGAVQRAAGRVLGAPPPLSAFPGGTDSAIFQGQMGIPTLPSFGPGLLSLAHSPNEYVPVEGIVQAAKIYALAAQGYFDAASRSA